MKHKTPSCILYKGTSLLEIIVVIGITTIILLAAGTLLSLGFRDQQILNDQLFGQKEARRIIAEIVNTARTAEASSVGSYAIAEATTSSLTLYANSDTDTQRERIHYWISGTDLKKGVLKPSGNPLGYIGSEQVTILAHNVENITKNIPTFQYFDESYTGMGTSTAMSLPITIPNVRMIKVIIQIEKDKNKSPVPIRVESLTNIRNLKTN